MTNQSPVNAEEKPSNDVGRDQSIRDEGERRWAYRGVKVLVLIVVLSSLTAMNLVGTMGVDGLICKVGVMGIAYGKTARENDEELRLDIPTVSFGWPLQYAFDWALDETDYPLIVSVSLSGGGPQVTAPYEIRWRNLSINIVIAIVLLLYLSHATTVIHRRFKPTYQFSVRFVVLVLPILVGGLMALWHYGLLSWRGVFLTVVYAAVVVCGVCLVGEVWGLVRGRKKAG